MAFCNWSSISLFLCLVSNTLLLIPVHAFTPPVCVTFSPPTHGTFWSVEQPSSWHSTPLRPQRSKHQQQHQHQQQRHSRTSAASSCTRLFVFERLSTESITCITTAQEQARKLLLPEVGNEVLMAGCVCHADPLLQRTLKQYSITWRRVQPTLVEMYSHADDNDNDDNNNNNNNKNAKGWLSNFRAAKDNDNDLPFSREFKQTLARSSKLADQMSCTTIEPYHLFLALLEYQEQALPGSGSGKSSSSSSNKVASAATIDDNNICTCGGWAVLVKMNVFDDEQVTALEVCQTLLEHILEDTTTNNSNGKELVTGASTNVAKTPTLAECGTDLTEQARQGLLDPVHGRSNEIKSCMRTLIRRRKNNVCLIGEPGVGKTAIAEGVAQILADDTKCPSRLRGYRLISLDLAALVAGTRYRGDFEERLQAIVKEVTDPKAPATILFLDEIHNIVGAGGAEGGMDASNLLKPALARGDLQLIGATTISEYRKYIEKDAALERRLQPVLVKEPSVDETISILQAVQSNYERHHRVKYTKEALEAAAFLSERYVNDRFLPDKALDLLDESGALAHLESTMADEEEADDDDSNGSSSVIVTEHTVAQVVSEWCGIPLGKLETQELDRLRALESEMERRVKGQRRAVRGVARAIRRARAGLRDPKRPIASLLFCGPTGTGKTELCKTLAETYFGSEKDMIRIDMSEYMERHAVSRLTGPPPGYIGYEEGGQLTEAVRTSPHSVVLLDELEKAHGDVLNLLLQIMEDGILTDGKGRTISFKNCILIMTSNVGSKRILEVARRSDRTLGEKSVQKLKTQPPEPRQTVGKLEIEPMRPEEVLKKLQSSPEAASLMLKASTDKDVMEAIRTAMNGSPADLLKAGQENPAVANFLKQLYQILEDDDVPRPVNGSKSPKAPAKSAIEVIRSSVTESLEQWGDGGKEDFVSGLADQMGVGSAAVDVTQGTQDLEHHLYPQLAKVVKEELELAMRPELLNRIDEIVVFSPLGRRDLAQIAQLLVDKTVERAVSEQSLQLDIDDSILERILEEGAARADQFGARPMRRAAQRYVDDSLSEALVQGFVQSGDHIRMELQPWNDATRSKGQGRRKEIVLVQRLRDGETMMVEVEDAEGGIGNFDGRQPGHWQDFDDYDDVSSTTTNGSIPPVSASSAAS
ncbi:hypothetical protein ACA910_002577 [Epithemia clementina (nom. ined.)]